MIEPVCCHSTRGQGEGMGAGVSWAPSRSGGWLAGVIGVAVTGWLLEKGGAGLLGWWEAFSVSAILCLLGSVFFLVAARGDRVFGETDGF